MTDSKAPTRIPRKPNRSLCRVTSRTSGLRATLVAETIHHPHHLGIRHRLPPVRLHRTPVLEREVRLRVGELRCLCFHRVDGEVEIVIVHVTDVHVYLAGELGTDLRPVC